MDVGVEWINTFGEACPQDQLAFCDETSEGFAAGMVAAGHRSAFDRGDTDAHERDFRDASVGGDDGTSIDGVGIVYFSSHGGTGLDNVFRGYLGSAADTCAWSSDEARLGDGMLQYLCLDACESVEVSRDPIAMWGSAFQGLHLLLGFTGLVSDSPWTSSRGNRFGARAGRGDPVGEAWLEESYSVWLHDHPVAMAAGRTSQDAESRLDGERIGASVDPIPNEQITAFVWKWRS